MDTTLPVTAGVSPRTPGAGAALVRSAGGTEAFSTHTGADPPKYKALVPVTSSVSCVLTVHWMLEQH